MDTTKETMGWDLFHMSEDKISRIIENNIPKERTTLGRPLRRWRNSLNYHNRSLVGKEEDLSYLLVG